VRVSLGDWTCRCFTGETNGLSQINAQAPYNLPGGVGLPLVVRTADGAAMTEVLAAESQPGVFTVNQSGQGQGIVVLGSNQTLLANAANPAARGEVVVIYCSGLGRTQPSVNPGEAAPSNPLANAVVQPSVTIGGRPATVQFAGLTPGFAGLYQINAVVPPDAEVGNAVPVVVTSGGAVSATVTMAVRWGHRPRTPLPPSRSRFRAGITATAESLFVEALIVRFVFDRQGFRVARTTCAGRG
jgi:uncharacterized protein (TIGR03437 family)